MKKIIVFLLTVSSLNVFAQNVGVGTTSPEMALHVKKPSDTALVLLDNATTLANNTNLGMYFKNGSFFTGAIKTIGLGSNTARLSFFTFAVPNQNNLAERLSISDNGNIGINNTAPAAKLDVTGSFKLVNGTQGAGKILTSDINGLTSWIAPIAPTTVGFRARLTNNVPVPVGTLTLGNVYTQEFEDGGNNFDPTTGVYTIPASGLYHFEAHANFFGEATGGTVPVFVRLNIIPAAGGTAFYQTNAIFPTVAGQGFSVVHTDNLKLLVGDQVQVSVSNNYSSTLTLSGGTSATSVSFSGYRVY